MLSRLCGAVLNDGSRGSIESEIDQPLPGFAAYGGSIRDALMPLIESYSVQLFDDGTNSARHRGYRPACDRRRRSGEQRRRATSTTHPARSGAGTKPPFVASADLLRLRAATIKRAKPARLRANSPARIRRRSCRRCSRQTAPNRSSTTCSRGLGRHETRSLFGCRRDTWAFSQAAGSTCR